MIPFLKETKTICDVGKMRKDIHQNVISDYFWVIRMRFCSTLPAPAPPLHLTHSVFPKFSVINVQFSRKKNKIVRVFLVGVQSGRVETWESGSSADCLWSSLWTVRCLSPNTGSEAPSYLPFLMLLNQLCVTANHIQGQIPR